MAEHSHSPGLKITRHILKSPFIHSHLPCWYLPPGEYGLRCNTVKRRGTLCDGVKQDLDARHYRRSSVPHVNRDHQGTWYLPDDPVALEIRREDSNRTPL